MVAPELYSPGRTTVYPWSPAPSSEEVARVSDLAEFELDVMKHAPSDWAGKALITFILQNAGPDVRAKVTVR